MGVSSPLPFDGFNGTHQKGCHSASVIRHKLACTWEHQPERGARLKHEALVSRWLCGALPVPRNEPKCGV